jgi:hypothetical protein
VAQKWPGFAGGRHGSVLRHIFGSATFTLAVHAFPIFVGVTAGVAAYHGGSGEIGATLVGLIIGALTLVAGQIAVAAFRSPIVRAAIALLFAVPAAMAGYHAVLGFARFCVPAEVWQQTFALIGAIAVGGTAWVRVALSIPPDTGLGDGAGCKSPLSVASAANDS